MPQSTRAFCQELKGVAPHPYFLTKVGGKVTRSELEGKKFNQRLKEIVKCLKKRLGRGKHDQSNVEAHRGGGENPIRMTQINKEARVRGPQGVRNQGKQIVP